MCRIDEELAEQNHLGLLTRDIAVALTQGAGLGDCLRRCAEALVRHLDAAFARIWTLHEAQDVLELQASAGMYTHLDGPHSRIPVGQLKVGLIARDREPHLINQVIGDQRFSDQEWARREGMIAFAGHPLICDDRVVGVMALFSRHELTRATLDALGAVADIIATGIAHWTAVEALHASEERFDLALWGSGAGLWDWNVLTGRVDFSPRFKEMLGYEVAEMEDTFASFETRLHPEDHDLVRDAVADHLERRVPYAVDYRLRTRSGEYRWFHARGQAIWIKAGKATRMLGSITDITDRKRSEERFRLLVEASPDALVITDRRGVIAMVNAQTEKLFGYRREDLIGQAVEILVPDRVRTKHVAQSGAYVGNPHARPMGLVGNLFGRHRDGHEFPVEISLSPVETEEGLLIAAAVRDVSDRERLMRELRDSESMYRLLAENSTDMISRHNPEGIYLYASPACRSLLGFEPEELVGRSACELIHADDRDDVGRVHSAILARPEPATVSFRILHKDGSFSWCESSTRAVRDPDTGGILEIQCVTRDISERKQAEDALKESEERTRSIVKHVADGIITIDATGLIRSVNPAVERLFGYGADELIGRNVNILMPEPYHGEHDGYLANYLRTGQPKVIGLVREMEGRRKDGTTFPLDLSVSEYSLAGTRMFTGVVRDITNRKRWRQRVAGEHDVSRVLAESRSIAEAALQLIEAIAGNLGWEAGDLWQIDREAKVLRCVEFWRAPSFACPEFEAVSRRITFKSGVGLPGRVWESGGVSWIPDLAEDANFPRGCAAAHDGLHWGIAFPIKSSEGTLGVIAFYRRQGEEPDDLMLRMFESITNQIARFIEHRNAERRIVERQAEVDIAQRIQLGFLPKAQPKLEGLTIAGGSRPAQETGGDYFDFIHLPNGQLMIPLGDVSGHGLGAAMIVAETRAYLRALALSGMHIDTILNFANKRLLEDTNGEQFVSLFLSLLNPFSRSLIYSNAGQGPGYIFDQKGDLRTTLESTDIPLGIEPEWAFHNDRATMLESGDLVLLLTDGILEARSSDVDFFGAGRAIEVVLAHRLEEPSVIIEHLIREACTFCRNVQLDDMTAIVIKVE